MIILHQKFSRTIFRLRLRQSNRLMIKMQMFSIGHSMLFDALDLLLIS